MSDGAGVDSDSAGVSAASETPVAASDARKMTGKERSLRRRKILEFLRAATAGNIAKMEALLKEGVSVNCRNEE